MPDPKPTTLFIAPLRKWLMDSRRIDPQHRAAYDAVLNYITQCETWDR